MWGACFQGSATPTKFGDAGSASPKNGASYMRAHSMRNKAKFCMVFKLDVGFFYMVDHAPTWPKFLVTRMLTRDLFAAANLLV